MARLIRSVLFVQKVLLVVCSLLIAVTFGVVVVLRYGFEMNLFAYEEWMMAAAFTLYFIGSAQGSFDNTHIKADLLKEWLRTEAAKRRVDSVIFGLEVLIGAVLSYWAYLMVADDLSRYPDLPATPVYSIPLAVPRGVILLGFVLMTIYSAMHFARLLAPPQITPIASDEARGDAP